MICSCGLEAVLKRFDTFEYYYCGECKKEVGLEDKPKDNFVMNTEGGVQKRKGADIPSIVGTDIYTVSVDPTFYTFDIGDAWLEEFEKWQKKNGKVITTAK